jgi:plastocyanin
MEREASDASGVPTSDRPTEEDLIVSSRVPARLRLAPNVSMLLLAGLLVLGGCGSSSKSSTSSPAAAPASTASGAGTTLSVAANPEGQLKFDTSSLTAKAGSVSISFANKATLPHNLTIASASGAVAGATATFQGGTKILALNLKPGTYKFYCSVPGHRAAGMEGTLTVN